ncbi:MAG: hypothetical protein WDA09_08930 [Bacteriovoracaceae bacterium]
MLDDEKTSIIANFLTNHQTIEYFDLRGNLIGDEGAIAVGNLLGTNSTPKLKTLDLSGNQIGERGATALAEGLSKNTSVKHVILYDNKFGPSGATSLAEMLKSNSTIKEFFVGGNQIGDEGASSFGDMLQTNSTLDNLSLPSKRVFFIFLQTKENNIGDDGVSKIADGMKSNQLCKLRVLDLAKNAFSKVGGEALYSTIAFNLYLERFGMLKASVVPQELSPFSFEHIRETFTTAVEHG